MLEDTPRTATPLLAFAAIHATVSAKPSTDGK